MTPIQKQPIHSDTLSLPSVKDILSRIEPPLAQHSISHFPINLVPANLLIQNQLRPLDSGDPSKTVKFSSSYSIDQGPAQTPNSLLSTQTSDLINGWTRDSERPTLDDLCVAVKTEPYLPIKAEPHLHSPANESTTAPRARFAVTPPHQSDYVYQPPRPVVATPQIRRELPPCSSSTSKISSNDRHKLSEKHRRDGQYAFILAANILSKGLDPGLLSGCTICIEDAADQPFSYHSSLCSDSSTSTIDSTPTSKKTKNDMLEDNLKCLFSVLLHLWPSELGKRLDELREEASQTAREREYGLRNDFAKSSKWHADVRATVYEQLLSTMEMQCHKHGVLPWDTDARKSMMSPPKSPASTLSERNFPSPTIGQKRSRRSTTEISEEERRVRNNSLHKASQ